MLRGGFFAICLLLLSADMAQAQQQMKDSEIHEMLVGRSVLFADYSVATFGRDGTYTYIAANNQNYRGTYTVSAGRICTAIESMARRCYAVRKDGLGMYLVTVTGEHLRFTIRSAMPPLVTATLCEVQVTYMIHPPEPGVPENVGAFSGVWLGKWDYGLCAALIVESVWPNGAASLVYVYGSFGLEGIKAGSSRFVGTIFGNKLTDGGRDHSLEFVMTNRNELAGKRYSPSSMNSASLSRQK